MNAYTSTTDAAGRREADGAERPGFVLDADGTLLDADGADGTLLDADGTLLDVEVARFDAPAASTSRSYSPLSAR
jgi:FMN phosphatase YigB (HAD superfamily)